MKYVLAKIADKVNQFYSTGEVTNTFFLDPAEIIEGKSALKNVEYCTYGGYDDAERKIIFVGTETLEEQDVVGLVRIASNKKLSHRDVLGSVLGLGIKREFVGDILINEEFCDIILMKNIIEYVTNNLRFVGNEKVLVSDMEIAQLRVPQKDGKEIVTSVQSLRLDSVISAGFGISREKSVELVKGELVKLNYIVSKSASKSVNEGDMISVRGKGRLIINGVVSQTKSGRIKINIFRI